jgi:Plasmid pRiA4b ORF-3-like protein
VVEGRDLPMYWMHLDVKASSTLATLDRFLKDTWLECCGYLSAFEIGGVRYTVDARMADDWDMGEKSMRVRLDKVLSPGQTSSYEYDYGTTTELRLRVISEREVEGKAIQLFARNTAPVILYEECGKLATNVCS